MGPVGRGGHTHGGGQALFPSLAETRPLLPSLPESCVVLTRLCLVRHRILRFATSTGADGPLTGLGAVEAHPGFSWATSPPGHAGGAQSSAPRAESRRPSLCTISKR